MSNARGHRSRINGRVPPRLIITRSKSPNLQSKSTASIWLNNNNNNNQRKNINTFRTKNTCMASVTATKQLSPTFPSTSASTPSPPTPTSGQTHHQLSHYRCYSNPSSPNLLTPAKCFTFSSSPSLICRRPNSASRLGPTTTTTTSPNHQHHHSSPTSPSSNLEPKSSFFRVHATKSLSPTYFTAHCNLGPAPTTSHSHPSGFLRRSSPGGGHHHHHHQLACRRNNRSSLDTDTLPINNGNRVQQQQWIKNHGGGRSGTTATRSSFVTESSSDRTRNRNLSPSSSSNNYRSVVERSDYDDDDDDDSEDLLNQALKQTNLEMNLKRSLTKSNNSVQTTTANYLEKKSCFQNSTVNESKCQEEDALKEFKSKLEHWSSLSPAHRAKLAMLHSSISLESIENNPGPCQDFGIRDYLTMTGESIDNEDESSVAGDFNVGLGVRPPRFSIDSLDATMLQLLEATEAKDRVTTLQLSATIARRCSDETGMLRRKYASGSGEVTVTTNHTDACNHGSDLQGPRPKAPPGKILRKSNSMPHANLPRIHESDGCVVVGTKAPLVTKRMELRGSIEGRHHDSSEEVPANHHHHYHHDVMKASREEGTIEEIDDGEWDTDGQEVTDDDDDDDYVVELQSPK